MTDTAKQKQQKNSAKAVIFCEQQSPRHLTQKESLLSSYLPSLLKQLGSESSHRRTVDRDNESITESREKIILIGVDGAANTLHKLKIIPDIIIGDMDSIDPAVLEYYHDLTEIKIYPSCKDETDTELALDWCIEYNHNIQSEETIEELIFINTLQGSFSHSMGIVLLLFKARENNIIAQIYNGREKILLLPQKWQYKAKPGNKISLIPLTESVTGIKTDGLEYPLREEKLFRSSTRGISNVFVDGDIGISYTEGELLVIIDSEPEDSLWMNR